MDFAQSSQDLQHGRDRPDPPMGSARPRHRSESRRLSHEQCSTNRVARKHFYLGTLHVRLPVRVFSRSAETWVDGELVNFDGGDLVYVEYEVGKDWCGKKMHINSAHLWLPAATASSSEAMVSSDRDVADRHPDGNSVGSDPALDTLREIIAARQSTMLRMPVTKAFDLRPVLNNAFVSMLPLDDDYEIEYQGSFDEDVLLKIYKLDARRHGRDEFDRYTIVGYIHAMQQPRVGVRVESGWWLGLMLHKNLNVDFLWKMKKEDPERYADFISRSTPGGFRKRGDPLAQTSAAAADYLISFTTHDKRDNDILLQKLASQPVHGPHGSRPIAFCTDRSLGIGGHFVGEADLYIGKHGFGMPVARGDWFVEYRNAASATKCGILILNPSPAYFRSDACLKEFSAYGIDNTLKNVCIQEGSNYRILPLHDYLGHVAARAPALFQAVRDGNVAEVDSIIISNLAAVESVDDLGKTPLNHAAWKGHSAVLTQLLTAAADVGSQDNLGSTALHSAAMQGHEAAVVQLIRAAADPKGKANNGVTPLHLAALKGHEAVSRMLLIAGSIRDEMDNRGETPYVFAKKGGHAELAELLCSECCPPQ